MACRAASRVARFPDSGKTLFPAVSGYLLHYLDGCVLAAAVAVKDDVRRQMPAVLSGLQRLQDKRLFHILRLTGGQNGIAENVADLAKVVETAFRLAALGLNFASTRT